MPKRKRWGVSTRVRISTLVEDPTSSCPMVSILDDRMYGPEARLEESRKAEERYQREIAGLSDESRRILSELQGVNAPPEPSEDIVVDSADILPSTDDNEWEDIPTPLQDNETFTMAVRDLESKWGTRVYKDERTWRQRVQRATENWNPLLPKLADAYVKWKHTGPRLSTTAPSSPPDEAAEPPETYNFTVDILDMYTLATEALVLRSEDDEGPAEALVLNGYLGTVPQQPTLAISLRTLEHFRVLRLFKPSFSVEAFTKLLCHYYMIPFRRRYRSALSDAFDIYLNILRIVDKKVRNALHRDTPNWRQLYGCAACGYALDDEPQLLYSRMLVKDANCSLKRMATISGRSTGDTRVFEESDFYLSTTYVDQFAHEVRGRQEQSKVDAPDRRHDVMEERASDELEGDPTDGALGKISGCTENWKAAAADEKKRMWGIFEETGIFACACRHGQIMWIADMIRSGELAKYPLAMVAKAMEVFGDRLLLGYDIGCSFKETVKRSSLGPRFEAQGCRCCTNAFHGTAHNYACQVENHPNVIEGMGLEDLETLERVFSASNNLATTTRYATAFRRRVFIDLFFQQWNDEKYANTGVMLYNNYKQALRILDTDATALAETMRSLSITTDDFKNWESEEQKYFKNVGHEAEWDVFAVAYVEALQELRETKRKLSNTSFRFLEATPADYQFTAPSANQPTSYQSEMSATRKLETQRRHLRDKCDRLELEVIDMEVKMNIHERWTVNDKPYLDTVQYISQRQYRRALAQLEKLVVQRLFELHKMNLTHLVYHVRSHLAKALSTRSTAIRKAVEKYNAAALALNPPKPTLDWTTVSRYSFIEEFDLLHDTSGDLLSKSWAQATGRAALKLWRRTLRAQEELVRCNVEARRLHTYIRDEEVLFKSVLNDFKQRADPWYGTILEYCQRRRSTNAYNLAWLQRMFALDGFTGNAMPGMRTGGFAQQLSDSNGTVDNLSTPSSSVAVEMREAEAEASGGAELDDDDDETGDNIGGLVDFISDLTLQ